MRIERLFLLKLLVCLFLLDGVMFAEEEQKEEVKIIFLNGPTSSGKTTLSRYLQDHLRAPYLYVGVDCMIRMMPQKLNSWEGETPNEGFSFVSVDDGSSKPRKMLKLGPFAREVLETFEEVVTLFASRGHNLIVDDIVFGEHSKRRWEKVLEKFRVVWVGIKTPLEELEKREIERGDRTVGAARDQYFKVHEGIDYDIEIDSSNSLRENVSKIVQFVEGRELGGETMNPLTLQLKAQ